MKIFSWHIWESVIPPGTLEGLGPSLKAKIRSCISNSIISC